MIAASPRRFRRSDHLQQPPHGSYYGKVMFREPMITRDYLLSKLFMCQRIKLPQRYLVGGCYPTENCIRNRAERRDYTVSLEGFVARAAN